MTPQTLHLRTSLLMALGLTAPLQGCSSQSSQPEAPPSSEQEPISIPIQTQETIVKPPSAPAIPQADESPKAVDTVPLEVTAPPIPDSTAPQAPESLLESGTLTMELLEGPTFQGGGVTITDTRKPVHGRPISVDGAHRKAKPIPKSDWAHSVSDAFQQLSPSQREQLAASWTQAGLMEHASIASFARFSLQLLELGAPPNLISGATRAQADEVAHARDCFSVASVLRGSPVGPGPLNLRGALGSPCSVAQVLLETIQEGCINETLAAAEASWLVEQTPFSSLQEILVRIARDETRHAALAWKTVQWILEEHPELRPAARAAFAAFIDSQSEDTVTSEDRWMAEFGIIPSGMREAVRQETLAGVIAVCSENLLGRGDLDNACNRPQV